MTGGSVAYYPFPDDGGATLDRVISRLPVEHNRATTWRPNEDWLLEVSPAFARGLSDMFEDAGVHQPDTGWRPGGVFVPNPIRTSIEAVLKCVPTSPATWFQVEGVEFDTAEARQAFEAAL